MNLKQLWEENYVFYSNKTKTKGFPGNGLRLQSATLSMETNICIANKLTYRYIYLQSLCPYNREIQFYREASPFRVSQNVKLKLRTRAIEVKHTQTPNEVGISPIPLSAVSLPSLLILPFLGPTSHQHHSKKGQSAPQHITLSHDIIILIPPNLEQF